MAKKEQSCGPDDEGDLLKGDQWDFVALDPDSRLVLSAFVGKRLRDNASDEWPGYPEVIREVFGVEATPPRTGRPGLPAGPRKEIPPGLSYATMHKERQKGRVVAVATAVVLGALAAVLALLGGREVSTSYLERHNGTDRGRNARKARRTYRFSKDFEMHQALTHFTMYSYNFCWPVRTLREEIGNRRYRRRTPAMAAGLTDRIWLLREWLAFPVCQP